MWHCFGLILNINDKLSVVFPSSENTLIGSLPKQRTFQIKSFYNSGFYDFDKNIVFINIYDLEDQLNLEPESRFLEVYFKDPTNINQLKIKLVEIYPKEGSLKSLFWMFFCKK